MARAFGIPEKTVLLSGVEKRIFELIAEYWPMSALEIAAHFQEDVASKENRKRASTKYCYYLKKLAHKRLIIGKRAGNSFIVWPFVVEKYRTIHDILSE